MMKSKWKSTLGLILFLVVFASCNNSQTNSEKDPIVSWMMNNSYPIETLELSEQQADLKQLEQIVGEAKVVCLGESRHDIREQFQLKHRFIKYMVEELGFTTFILEASLPYSELINGFIQKGEGNIDEIMANMPGWFLWDTQEMSEIISWMRAYNVSPENEKKLQFYGIDIVAPEYGLNSIFDYLKKFDAAVYEELQSLSFANDLLDDSNWQATLQRVSALPSQEKDVLRANYRSLYDQILHNKVDYISLSGSKDYNWILRLAFNAQQATRMFTADTRLSMGLIRDSAMAANTLWIHRSLAKSEKTIIWAHNVHITKGEFTMTGESESIRGMGYILAQALKDDMISIGASFSQADESTIDGTLAKIGMKFGLLDLKGKTQDQDVINWLNTKKVMLGQGFEMTCIPSKSFDAIFFIDSISRTIPNQASLARFRNLN